MSAAPRMSFTGVWPTLLVRRRLPGFEQPNAGLAAGARRSLAEAISPNERIQYALHPWTSYVIVPLFALANAGVHITGGLLSDAVSSPITIGIVAAYVVGKPLGIFLVPWLATRAPVRKVVGGGKLTITWPGPSGRNGVIARGSSALSNTSSQRPRSCSEACSRATATLAASVTAASPSPRASSASRSGTSAGLSDGTHQAMSSSARWRCAYSMAALVLPTPPIPVTTTRLMRGRR